MLSFHKQRETVTLSFGTGDSRGFRLDCFSCLRRIELNKPQNNLQNSCISRLSEDLPECFRISETCSQTHVIWAQKGLVNDAWMEHVHVTALSGADWQVNQRLSMMDLSFPSHRQQLYHRTGSPPHFPPERKRQRQTERGRTRAMESMGTNKKKEALSSWVLRFPFQL